MTEGRLLKPLPERDWRAYSAAQAQEARLFDGLLWDLLQTVEEPEYQGNGRPRLPLREVLFCAVKKAHTGFSSRRNQGFIEDAADGGMLTRAPHYNAAFKLLNLDGTDATLRRLVQLAAIPLAGIEQDFAVDSTGFSAGNYNHHRRTKYRLAQDRRQWVKLHACVGVLTNIITDATATPNSGVGTGDTTHFEPLVNGTADSFAIREVSADGAYASKANHWVVSKLGGEALIPFRGGTNTPPSWGKGSSGQSPPDKPGAARIWRRAYHYFKLNEEEFFARYHKRSNVEATFGAIKQTLGERLKAKTITAQRNEVLCKVVAWNIRCVVRAMVELGVEPTFQPAASAPKPPTGEGV
jgi:hypothetical protein